MNRVSTWRLRLNGYDFHVEVAVKWLGFAQGGCGCMDRVFHVDVAVAWIVFAPGGVSLMDRVSTWRLRLN